MSRHAVRVGLMAAALAAGCGGGGQGQARPAHPAVPSAARTAPPVALADLHGSLVSVEVSGLAGTRLDAARAALKSAKGAGFDRAQVARDVRALWQLGGVADVVAKARPAAGGVALRFEVTPRGLVRLVDVRGSHAVPVSQWLGSIGIAAGDVYDPAKVAEVRGTMMDRFQQMGYRAVKVTSRVHRAQDGRVDLVLVVDEGPKLVVSHLAFRGNHAVDSRALLALLAQHGGTQVNARYWRGGLEDGLMNVTAAYYDRGYIEVKVGPPEETLARDRASVALVIPVHEGHQFRIGAVKFEGALAAPAAQYRKLMGVKTGQVFSRKKLTEGIQRVTAYQRDKKGQPRAAVTPQTQVHVDTRRVDLTFNIAAGG